MVEKKLSHCFQHRPALNKKTESVGKFTDLQNSLYSPCVSAPPGAQRSWQQTANGHTHLSMSIFSSLSCIFLCMNIQMCMNFTFLRESHKSH